MIRTSNDRQQSAFSWWLRTGSMPSVPTPARIERKFNPWHDPSDGRFTFAGAVGHYGVGGAKPVNRASDRKPGSIDRHNPRKPRIAARPDTEVPRAGQTAQYSKKPIDRGTIDARSKPAGSQRRTPANPTAAFIGGVGEGVYDVASGAVAGTYAALTTNPVTTVRNVGRGIADAIDRTIAAEDTPARIQVSRAAGAIANASARDIGRAAGSVAGNVALSVAPGAALGKVSALRRLRMVKPRTTYDPPQIGWVKENLVSDKPWKIYNDTATGARPGQAPTLMRTMSDGSKRPVKFDGVEGEYVIDRKFGVVDAPRGRAQLLRQSEVLAQNGLTATWEVPNAAERVAAFKLLKKMSVTNIKVRIVKP